MPAPCRRERPVIRAPLGTIFVPILHQLIHPATVHTAGQIADLLNPVTKEHGAWAKLQVVNIAVQGLVHSENELRHALTPGALDRNARGLLSREDSIAHYWIDLRLPTLAGEDAIM